MPPYPGTPVLGLLGPLPGGYPGGVSGGGVRRGVSGDPVLGGTPGGGVPGGTRDVGVNPPSLICRSDPDDMISDANDMITSGDDATGDNRSLRSPTCLHLLIGQMSARRLTESLTFQR
jgi:hypothetical protein